MTKAENPTEFVVLHGDCLEKMAMIPDGSVDMVMTSPPYDNLRSYNNSLEWGEHVWKPVIKELFRVVKDGGVVVWVVGDATCKGSETGVSFKQAIYFREVGFNIHDTMIWEKPNPTPQFINKRYRGAFEYMFVFSKGSPATFNAVEVPTKYKEFGKTSSSMRERTKSNDRRQSTYDQKPTRIKHNVWTVATQGYKGHPAVFPISLAEDHIKSWSNRGDTILDPFMGSGTTGVACVNLNRQFIGIEKDDKYF